MLEEKYPADDDDPGLDEILRMRPGKERNERLREWATKAKNGSVARVQRQQGAKVNSPLSLASEPLPTGATRHGVVIHRVFLEMSLPNGPTVLREVPIQLTRLYGGDTFQFTYELKEST